MSEELDLAANTLFPPNGTNRVGNVKFFRGRRRDLTAEELAEQFNRADAQVRSGDLQPHANIDGERPST